MPGFMTEIASVGDFNMWINASGCGTHPSPPSYVINYEGENGNNLLDAMDVKEFMKMKLEKRPDLVKDIRLSNNQNVLVRPSDESIESVSFFDDTGMAKVEQWATQVLELFKI